MTTSKPAVGYVRVASVGPDSQDRLAIYERKIRAAAAEAGWQLRSIYRDEGVSGNTIERPGLLAALREVEGLDRAKLVVLRLRHLSRSAFLYGQLAKRAKAEGWEIVSLTEELWTKAHAAA